MSISYYITCFTSRLSMLEFLFALLIIEQCIIKKDDKWVTFCCTVGHNVTVVSSFPLDRSVANYNTDRAVIENTRGSWTFIKYLFTSYNISTAEIKNKMIYH